MTAGLFIPISCALSWLITHRAVVGQPWGKIETLVAKCQTNQSRKEVSSRLRPSHSPAAFTLAFIMLERRWFANVSFACICHLAREMLCDHDYCGARIYGSLEAQWKKSGNYRLPSEDGRTGLPAGQAVPEEVEGSTNRADRADEQ